MVVRKDQITVGNNLKVSTNKYGAYVIVPSDVGRPPVRFVNSSFTSKMEAEKALLAYRTPPVRRSYHRSRLHKG